MDFTRKLWPGCAALWAVAIAAALTPRLARATEVATRLEYSAAPGCPGAEDFAAVVTGRLGYRPFRKDASERVVVRIEPEGKALEGRIEWRDGAGGWIGEQTLPSRTGNCPELARAMGFALAVQFQLMATMGRPTGEARPPAAPARAQPPAAPPSGLVPPGAPPTPTTAATSTAASASSSVTPPPPATAPQPIAEPPAPPPESLPSVVTRAPAVTSPTGVSSGPSLSLGIGAAAAFGAAPDVVPLGRLFGAVRWTHVVIELAGEVSSSSTTRREDGTGFTHRQLLGSLAGCGVLSSWGACLLAKAGEMRVTGLGVALPASPTGFVMQMGTRLTWTHMLGEWFEIAAHADGLALATKGEVTVDSMPVWTTPRFTASLGVDVGVRFR